MTDFEIQKFGEIQYLKGRLDELHKAYPTITNMERSRKLDGRISKYYKKLKERQLLLFIKTGQMNLKFGPHPK